MEQLKAHEELVQARNTIDRGGWAYERPDGKWVYPEGTLGTCLSNAMPNCLGPGYGELVSTLGVEDPDGVFAWNDTPGRTKAEVLAVLDEAIARTAPEPDLQIATPEQEMVVA